MKTVRILSIDGGGIRGLMPAAFLAALEDRAGRPVHEMFDLVTGTSTGALLAAGLVKHRPLTAAQVRDYYIRDGDYIFTRSPLRRVASALVGPKYDDQPLENVLLAAFGDTWLSDCIVPLLIPSYELGLRQAWFFKSWKAQGRDIPAPHHRVLYDYRLRDVVRAAVAAPTYFRPAKFLSRAGQEGVFIDGAVVANNPALCALASARRLNPDAKRFLLLSLGTGQYTSPIGYTESSAWGLVNWARPLLDCMMDGAADVVAYQVDEAFGNQVLSYRFDFSHNPLPLSSAIDDATSGNIRNLVVTAEREIARNDSVLTSLATLLSGNFPENPDDYPDSHPPEKVSEAPLEKPAGP